MNFILILLIFSLLMKFYLIIDYLLIFILHLLYLFILPYLFSISFYKFSVQYESIYSFFPLSIPIAFLFIICSSIYQKSFFFISMCYWTYYYLFYYHISLYFNPRKLPLISLKCFIFPILYYCLVLISIYA